MVRLIAAAKMQPSVTGMQTLSKKKQHHGFTLIEVLVVLIIIAVITGIAATSFGHFGENRREKIIVQQFARTIEVAQQQALLTPSILGLSITDRGYQFFQYEILLNSKRAEWMPLRDDMLSNKTAFEKTFAVRVTQIAHYSLSEKSGQNRQTQENDPRIVFSPSGYVTPFALTLKGKQETFVLRVNNNGLVSVK